MNLKRYFIATFYRLRPRSAILKTRIKLLTVGDLINHRIYIKGKIDGSSRKVAVDAISDKTITVRFFDVYSKKYIRFLPNGELVLLAFGD